jgi:hypothetical protein
MTGAPRRIRLRFALLLSALVLCGTFLFAAGPDVNTLPKPTGYVSDLANVIDAGDKATLEAYCFQVEQQLGVQLAIVTIDTVGDAPIEDFALDLFRHWGIGSKKDNSGVLLLLSVKDRKSRIQTGRGVEAYLTDGFSAPRCVPCGPIYGPVIMARRCWRARVKWLPRSREGKEWPLTKADSRRARSNRNQRHAHRMAYPFKRYLSASSLSFLS